MKRLLLFLALCVALLALASCDILTESEEDSPLTVVFTVNGDILDIDLQNAVDGDGNLIGFFESVPAAEADKLFWSGCYRYACEHIDYGNLAIGEALGDDIWFNLGHPGLIVEGGFADTANEVIRCTQAEAADCTRVRILLDGEVRSESPPGDPLTIAFDVDGTTLHIKLSSAIDENGNLRGFFGPVPADDPRLKWSGCHPGDCSQPADGNISSGGCVCPDDTWFNVGYQGLVVEGGFADKPGQKFHVTVPGAASCTNVVFTVVS